MERCLNIPEDKLNQYIQYFSQAQNHYIIEDESKSDSCYKHYQYTEELEAFVAWVSEMKLLKSNYMILLEQKNIHLTLGDAMLNFIQQADAQTVLAILTYCIRYERFCEGLWLLSARDGFFLAILKRLSELNNR